MSNNSKSYKFYSKWKSYQNFVLETGLEWLGQRLEELHLILKWIEADSSRGVLSQSRDRFRYIHLKQELAVVQPFIQALQFGVFHIKFVLPIYLQW